MVKNGRVHILKNGNEILNKNISIKEVGKPETITLENITKEDVLFININPIE